MAFGFFQQNSIIYVLIAWFIIFGVAKAAKLDKRGFEIKPYSLTYKNKDVQMLLTRLLGRTERATRIFSNTSVVLGFIMMGAGFWYLISNLSNFFVKPESFAEMTVLIPGVTIQSSANILYFLLAVPIVLVMHEGAHGIVATLEKIKIKTGGFAVFIALFAGFVEPDEEEFAKAKKISRLRVIGAGATSNVIFSFVIAGLLLFNPSFALIMPDGIRNVLYTEPLGVPVIQVEPGSGAEKAGMQKDDVITAINGVHIALPQDFAKVKLKPGDTATVTVTRGGQTLQLPVSVTPSKDDPQKGMLGIMRAALPSYQPVVPYYIHWSPEVFMFLLWLWMLSFFIGIFNMLPLPILDGGKFIHSIIEKKMSDKALKGTMMSLYVVTFLLFGLNIGLSALKSGFITI
ncbi:MAG TPA: site-2 protease family protein [Candidatus Nitrosotalea sp.]|nr:site-2 protease family protein [Candidatus Nitrosotalea sp.]